MTVSHLFSILIIIFASSCSLTNSENVTSKILPLVAITWDYRVAIDKAWEVLNSEKRSALDAVEEGINACEEDTCRMTVGYGGHPDENGETTLDAMIMDGVKMDTGAVAGLRRIKKAISVARKVLENTDHSLLVGELATEFAVKMGFPEESLESPASRDMWLAWKANKCQPNFWKNVSPDPKQHCGPYEQLHDVKMDFPGTIFGKNDLTDSMEQCDLHQSQCQTKSSDHYDQGNHDTIGMVAIDINGNIAAGTSTNGLEGKIPGRVGDSPIVGSGCYADQEVGAAAGTGNGDVLMRFLPSFYAVEEMRRGASPTDAVKAALNRVPAHLYPEFFGAVVAINKKGEYGVACRGKEYPNGFPMYIINPLLEEPKLIVLTCRSVA